MPLIGQYEKTTRISGPVCPDGGHLRAVVSLSEEPGQIVIALHAECANSCLTDNLEPYVGIKVIDMNDAVRTELSGELPLVPGKGWPWNGDPRRDMDHEVVLATSLNVKRIDFEMKNMSHGSVFLDFIEFAGGLALEIIGALGAPHRGFPEQKPGSSAKPKLLSKDVLAGVMDKARGDAVEAARTLGISRVALYEQLAAQNLLKSSASFKRA